jgi:predicted CXXCH cytochrome family protein
MAAMMLFAMSGTALANYGPHGGYDADTDACAGCHRAHSAVSEITYDTPPEADGGEKNALLIGTTATTLKEFCYTCHADAGTGATTNVSAGTLSGSGVLNGGGFDTMGGAAVSSTHDVSGAGGLAWGGGVDGDFNDGPGIMVAGFDCASCHDPHGSSNYRILKDTVNGVAVGGYDGTFASATDPDPQPFVVSNETSYPTGGFRLHVTASTLGYTPNYTSAQYAKAPSYATSGVTPPVTVPATPATATNTGAGISGWCAACHTTYNTVSADGQGEYNADGYDPAVGYGDVVRHRHPVNVALSAFVGDRNLIVDTGSATNTPWGDAVDIPLEHNPATEAGALQDNTTADFMGCLTCHRAHGTTATMSGYADSSSNVNPNMDAGVGGTPPTLSSALLRANDRGVCERCHNK